MMSVTNVNKFESVLKTLMDNLLRLTFEKLKSNKVGDRTWWEIIGEMDGLMELFEEHKNDLTKL